MVHFSHEPHVLVVSTHSETVAVLARALKFISLVHHEVSTTAACTYLSFHQVALTILDVRKLDDLVRIGRIRTATQAPVLVLTDAEMVSNAATYQDFEGDGLLVRDMPLPKLQAELQGWVERSQMALKHTDLVRCEELTIDFRKHVVATNGKPISVTPNEWKMLSLLVQTAPLFIPTSELLLRIWGLQDGNTLPVRQCISKLREKIGDDARKPRYIFKGHSGYRFADVHAEVEREVGASFIQPAVPPRWSATLPAQITSFVGRADDLQKAQRLLQSLGARLMTIWGVGGIGKTRFALQLANELDQQQVFRDGVRFVGLDSVHQAEQIVSAIARSLNFTDGADSTLSQEEQLMHYLKEKHMLLVLDNAEHLIAAVRDWAITALSQAPAVVLLITSRETLQLYGEQLFELPPLGLPDHPTAAVQNHLDLKRVGKAEAVQLFIARAQLVQPAFELSAANAELVSTLCHVLEGLPLALELAAARMSQYGLAAIVEQLTRQLLLLSHMAYNLPARQQTLLGTLLWSYNLLLPIEQATLRRLGVCVGGWSLACAQSLCADDGDNDNLSNTLFHLQQKSFIRSHVLPHSGELRWSMIDLIRAFSHEQRVAQAEHEGTIERFISYYVELAEQAEPQLVGQEQDYWLQRLDQEHANIQAVLYTLIAQQQRTAALQIIGALWRYWYARGFLAEPLSWLKQVSPSLEQEAFSEKENFLVARAFNGGGVLAFGRGMYAEAQHWLEQAHTLFERIGYKEGVARTANNLGLIAQRKQQYELAEQWLTRCIHILPEHRDHELRLMALHNLAINIWQMGDLQRAFTMFDAIYSACLQLHDLEGVAYAQESLGAILSEQGDQARAIYELQGALQIWKDKQDTLGIARMLSQFALTQPQHAEVSAWLQESLRRYQEAQATNGLIEVVEVVSWLLAADRAKLTQARWLWDAAVYLRKRYNVPPLSHDVRRYAPRMNSLPPRADTIPLQVELMEVVQKVQRQLHQGQTQATAQARA